MRLRHGISRRWCEWYMVKNRENNLTTHSEGTHKSNGESLDVGVNKCG